MAKPLIALDADGVLLDFHLGYASAWERAFGVYPKERDPLAYWPIDRWEVERLQGDRLSQFGREFGSHFWRTVPAVEGALDACHRLVAAGFDLVCVSALNTEFEADRLHNLRDLGFPIERVIATGHSLGDRSPKADALAQLKPLAFVDDYLAYLRGLPDELHTALVLRAPNGSPNTGPDMAKVKSVHQDLAAFTDTWLR